MTTVTGTYSNYDSDYLTGLATAALGTHTATQFVLTEDVYTVTVFGSGMTYSNNKPSGGTLTSMTVTAYGETTTWTDLSVSVSALWSAVTTHNVTAFNNLLYSGDDTFTATGGAPGGFAGWGGNDTFNMQASTNADFLSGGDGNDTFNYNGNFNPGSQIDGGAGTDTLNLNGDYLGFTGLGDLTSIEIVKLGGGHSYYLADTTATTLTIDGSALGAGDFLKFDGVWSGTGSLLVSGGAGNDTFLSGKGNDTFNAGAGNDTIDYSHASGGVTVNLNIATAQAVGGGAGSDTLTGVENIVGTDFADTLTGDGNDNIFYSGGIDGHDTVDGGGGNDTYSFGDIIAAASVSGVTIDLRDNGAQNLGVVKLTSIENVVGSPYADTFIGSSADNVMNGGGGIDTITYQYATGGMSFVQIANPGGQATFTATGGGQGNDTFSAMSIIVGTDFNDTFSFLGTPQMDIRGGGGNDTMTFENAAQGVGVLLGGPNGDPIDFVSIETLTGSSHDDTLGGDNSDNVINGGAGNDTISGGAGNDTLNGGDDNDTISGGAGSDILNGGAGDDTLFGGDTNFEFDGNDVLNGGAGNDKLYAGGANASNSGTVILNGGAGDDLLVGGGGETTASYQDATGGVTVDLRLSSLSIGGAVAQAVGGGQGSDTLVGIQDLVGSAFNDTLTGSDFQSQFSNVPGDNVITGGGGDDRIDGGTGIDTAVFSGNQADYSITSLNGNVIVADLRAGHPDGTDTLTSIEFLQFADGKIAANPASQPPVLANATASVGYTEQGSPIAIEPAITLNDPDSAVLTGATITISGGYVAGDFLDFSNIGVGGSWDAASHTLTLTTTTSPATFQAELRTVTFSSTSDDPTAGGADPTRTITITATDGVNTSTPVTTTIDVTAVNDAPTLGGMGSVVIYTAHDAGVVLDDAVTVGDVDSALLAGASVSIANGFVAGDSLNFTSQGGISGSYNAATHVLTLSGAATAQAYLTALRTVTFSSSADDPTAGGNLSRTIAWTVDDGGPANHQSDVGSTTVNITPVNHAPQLGGAGNTAGYTEQAAPVALDSGLTVSDDGLNLTGATVKISAGFVAGDTLNFANQNGISGSYNAATHILTLSGTSSVGHYEAALRSVTFSSASDNPDNYGASTARTITWSVDDGQATNHASNTPVTTLNITAIDDLPVAHNDAFAAGEQIAIGPLLSVFADNGGGADSDPDNPSLAVTAVNGVAASVGHQITLASGALLTLNANGSFAYDPNGVFDSLAAPGSGASDISATDSFTYTINGTVETATVTIAGVDSNDTLHGTSGNDAFDGGIGNDTLVLTGNHADYTIAFDAGTMAYTVHDNRAGSPDGTDTVRNVENFQFADGTVSFATYVGPDNTIYDAANDTPWASQLSAIDGSGSLASQTVVSDGGTRWVNTYDTTSSQSWAMTTASYDSGGHQLTQFTVNDDGTRTLTLFDAANQYAWANATLTYDANGNVTGLGGTNDNGTHTIAMKDIAAALDTAQWYAAPYDANQGAAASVTLTGGGNVDMLYGHAGNDTLSGMGGNDILSGGAGSDTLTGGAGDDRFVFHNGDGLDVITDFTAGDTSGDTIELHAYGIANFAALQPFMSQSGSDVVIAFDPDNTITLQHVTLGQLNAGDFMFA